MRNVLNTDETRSPSRFRPTDLSTDHRAKGISMVGGKGVREEEQFQAERDRSVSCCPRLFVVVGRWWVFQPSSPPRTKTWPVSTWTTDLVSNARRGGKERQEEKRARERGWQEMDEEARGTERKSKLASIHGIISLLDFHKLANSLLSSNTVVSWVKRNATIYFYIFSNNFYINIFKDVRLISYL